MADSLDDILRSAPNQVRVGLDPDLPRSKGRARSHLDDGRTFVWDPPLDPEIPRAVDAERRRTPPPALASTAALQGDDGFWEAWTRLEVIAKLLDRPVVTLLPKGPLSLPGLATATFEHGDLVVTVGTWVPFTAPDRSA